MARTKILASIVVQGDQPPTEFRIFTAGAVETTKGTFVFDEEAAARVMAEYAAHGIDLMVDYDHASLASVSLDPAQAGKAAAWFELELRAGELWAVNVRWTPPAAEALKRKEWRFMSPAFQTEDGRIVSLLNVAITNLPATRRLEPLMAASAKGTPMNEEQVKEALDALIAGDAEKCAELLKGLIAAAAASEPAAEEAPAAEPASDAEATAAAEEVAPPAEEEEPAAVAANAKLQRLTGKDSTIDALAEIEVWKASHVALETERQTLATEKAVLEASERKRLCAKLVNDAGQAPSAVWANAECQAPKAYLAAMSLKDFTDYVADQCATKAPAAKKAAQALKAPVVPADGEYTLSARELAMCAEMNIDPKAYAAKKAALKKAKG